MNRLQIIEERLRAINETVFQELCDCLLVLRNNNYAAFSRVGSQVGKQKTIKGSPDTLLLLPNGKYLLVEYSTNVTRGVKKLKDDILKCMESAITKIPLDQIAEIVVCINFNLRNDEIHQLQQLLKDTKILLTLYTLDALAIELHLNHRDLVHQYLGLSIDTGQVVSLDRFVDEYDRASNGIATPLNNPFLHRDRELRELKEIIKAEDFIILTGPPGIGKTKLAIETINSYLTDDFSFKAFCVSYKNHTLFNDLQMYLSNDNNYILFVDDANRIDAFSQITGFYREARKGKLKIVVTVRDYAYQELRLLCGGLRIERYDLKKLTDEQIKDIISGQPWNIKNPIYHDKILAISDGNPRLAIMAAQLALAQQRIETLYDVSELFDVYFSTFLRDKSLVDTSRNIRVLGVIAFFYTLPFKNKLIISPILEKFSLDYNDFIESIDILDKHELVDIQFEYVKIPEQNLATFFFYKAFIKTELLSLSILLENFYQSNSSRLKECIISSNNTFGPLKVMDKVRPYLQEQLKKIQYEGKISEDFLTTFWFYLKTETLEYLYLKIASYNSDFLHEYKLTYETNEFAYDKNNTIELLGNFFNHPDAHLKDAIELAFLFVEKQPERLAELIHKVRETLVFDREDIQYGLHRQNVLFHVLISGLISDNRILALSYFELSKTFLKFSFQHTKSARHYSIQFYTFTIDDSPQILEFRKKIWETIDVFYNSFPDQAFEVLKSYAEMHPDVEKAVMTYDINFVVEIISKHLSSSEFEHCKYVQKQIRWCRRHNIEHPSFSFLIQHFVNKDYEIYLKLDWDRFRDKQDYEFDDYEEYEKLKEEEVRKSFIFNSESEIDEFYKIFSYLRSNTANPYKYDRAIDLIVDENFSINFTIGTHLLKHILKNHNSIGYIPWIFFRNKLNVHEVAFQVSNIIYQYEFEYKEAWEISFYEHLEAKPLMKEIGQEILMTLQNLKRPITIHVDRFTKYNAYYQGFIQQMLHVIVKKNNDDKIGVRLWPNTFDTHFGDLGTDMDIIKKAYLQQNLLQGHFDYLGNGLKHILDRDPDFITPYVKSLYSDDKHGYRGESEDLSIVWSVNDIEKVLFKTFDHIVEKEFYIGFGDHFCNCFFRRFENQDMKNKATEFLFKYARIHNRDAKRMNVVIDIARITMKEAFEPLLLQHVSLNQDVDVFAKIWWRGNGGITSGDTILGDIEAAEWRSVQAIVQKSEIGLSLIPIKKYIVNQIEWAIKNGDNERQRRFLDRY